MLIASLNATGSLLIGLTLLSGNVLSGRVIDQDGQPLPGAVVRINQCNPKNAAQVPGSGDRADGGKADHGKIALADQHGQFRFEGLSKDSLFVLAAGASGCQGKVIRDVDAESPDEIEFRLATLNGSDISKTLEGQIIDHNELPVAGAVVAVKLEPFLFAGLPTPNAPFTRSTVADVEGKFTLLLPIATQRIGLEVSAPGYATAGSQSLRMGRQNPPIRLNPGASLTGRIVTNGTPVSGLQLEIVQKDRTMGHTVTPQQITTDDQGVFQLNHLQPECEHTLASLIGQSKSVALPVSLVSTPKSGLLADLGDIATQRALTLTVQFTTLGGESIPAGATCFLTRHDAVGRPSQAIPTALEQPVVFDSLAAEVIELGIRVPGFEVIKTDPFCQVDLNRRLNLKLASDTTLTIALQKVE